MESDLFEGQKNINIFYQNSDERKDFDDIKKKLGLKFDLDLIDLCVAIALRKKYNDKTFTPQEHPRLTKLTGIATFTHGKLYDLLISNYLSMKTKRFYEFEKYFYAGFKILNNWYKEQAPSIGSPLDCLISLTDELM